VSNYNIFTRSDGSWGQRSEEAFIASLGKFSHLGKALGAAKLLLGYLDGLDKRTDWCKLDEAACRAAAQVRLKTLS